LYHANLDNLKLIPPKVEHSMVVAASMSDFTERDSRSAIPR